MESRDDLDHAEDVILLGRGRKKGDPCLDCIKWMIRLNWFLSTRIVLVLLFAAMLLIEM